MANPTPDTITITKRLKRELRFTFDGRSYALNRHGVLCSITVRPDGKEWFTFTNFDYRAELDLRDALKTGSEVKGRDRVYAYT